MSKGELVAIPKGDDGSGMLSTNFTIVAKTVEKPKTEPTTEDARPNAEKVEAVIARIESGQSERSACMDENISRSTFRTTALRVQAGDQYARALFGLAQDQVESIEVILAKLESTEIDPQTAKVILDNRRWFASKFLPKQYGDKIDHTTNGKDMVIPILGGITTPDELTE